MSSVLKPRVVVLSAYAFIRAQSADDVVYHFMRLLKQRLSRDIKTAQYARIRCSRGRTDDSRTGTHMTLARYVKIRHFQVREATVNLRGQLF